MRSPGDDQPSVPGVRVISLPDPVAVTEVGTAGDRVIVTVAGARVLVSGLAGPGLAERIADRLAALVEHCVAADPEYSAADFPEADLDDDGMARLLAGLDLDEDTEVSS
jgi:hypothetical protein